MYLSVDPDIILLYFKGMAIEFLCKDMEEKYEYFDQRHYQRRT